MKKIIKTLILVLVVVLALTVFVACKQEEETLCTHEGGTATCGSGPICTLCGAEYGEPVGEHTLVAYGEDAPTCTEEGKSSGVVCSVCGYEERRRFPIPALGHNMADATCTEPSTCTRKDCGYTEGEALGHDMVAVEALDPTCTAEGYTAHLGCSRCDYTEGKEDIEATGHTLAEVEAKAATCTEAGYTAHKACECGYTEGKEVIEATGHDMANATCIAPATCKNGCGYTEGEATGHTLAEVEAKAPTCTEDGYTAHKVCSVCGATEGKEVIAASHSLVDGVCSVCGYISNVFANKLFVGVGDAAANVYSASFGYSTLTDGIIYEEGKGRFSSKQNGGRVEGIIDLGAVYDLDELKVYLYWGGLDKFGTGFEIQVCFGGEWTTVVKCESIEEMQAYWVDNPDSVDKDWLVFDLGGVAARQVKFIIPGQTSSAWTTFYEIECSGKVSTAVEPEPEEPVLIDNIFSGKVFTPTADATASILAASWWKGSGYEGLTDGIKNADNAPGRFSTAMALTGMMDATIDLGGTYELHSLKFYTYDPTASTGAGSLGADLLIQVYVDGEWKDVVTIADNATLATYLVVNEGSYNDYLEFDLGGVKAEKIRFYISASASSSGTTYEEIECSGYQK